MNFKDFILCFNPLFWLMNNRYSKELDDVINYLLDNNEISYMDKYTIKVGNYNIWISNYPYACGHLYNWNTSNSPLYTCRPSRSTIVRLKNRCILYKKTFKTKEQIELEKEVKEIIRK